MSTRTGTEDRVDGPDSLAHAKSGIAVVAAVNNEVVLETNLLRSPLLQDGRIPVVIERGHSSAAAAYNTGLRKVDADLVIFVHQDVYIPRGWEERLYAAIEALEKQRKPWGVLGVFGIDSTSYYHGRVWSTGLGRELGYPSQDPYPVTSLDELLLVVRRSSNLSFDEQHPGFHLFGTDICLDAHQRNLGTYVFPGPVVHNSVAVKQLGADYVKSYRHLQRKWADHLPVPTCVVPVTRFGWPLARFRLKSWGKRARRRESLDARLHDPVAKARELGYE